MSEVKQTLDQLFGQTEERCLQMFAESILHANRYGSNKWGITLYRGDRVRLNVGSVVVCTLHRGRIWFALDRDYHSTADYEFLDHSEDWKWTPQHDYKVVSSMSGYYFPSSAQKHSEAWHRIRKMHFSLIEKVAGKYARLRKPCQKSHSPEFLEYLRSRLGQSELPNPIY